MTIKVAIDIMGGDHGLNVTLPASFRALEKFADLELLLVGNESQISEALLDYPANLSARIQIVHAEQVVDMDELPSVALRKKRKSSMRIAINQVKDNAAHACVSAGNTGALMAISKFVLKTLKGIDRPAICAIMPTSIGHVHMLDLGANIDSDKNALLQFAVMGSALAQTVDNNPSPKVGLLNIGEEEIKGLQRIKDANTELQDMPLNYIGYVEGDDIFTGKADVVVCDGFEGNIALKSSEGVAKLIIGGLKKSFKRNWMTKLIALIAMPVLKDFAKSMDPGKYNGASLLGLKGIVVKSHGGADEASFTNAIAVAYHEAERNVPERIVSMVDEVLNKETQA